METGLIPLRGISTRWICGSAVRLSGGLVETPDRVITTLIGILNTQRLEPLHVVLHMARNLHELEHEPVMGIIRPLSPGIGELGLKRRHGSGYARDQLRRLTEIIQTAGSFVVVNVVHRHRETIIHHLVAVYTDVGSIYCSRHAL